jgi:hypothetical protein
MKNLLKFLKSKNISYDLLGRVLKILPNELSVKFAYLVAKDLDKFYDTKKYSKVYAARQQCLSLVEKWLAGEEVSKKELKNSIKAARAIVAAEAAARAATWATKAATWAARATFEAYGMPRRVATTVVWACDSPVMNAVWAAEAAAKAIAEAAAEAAVAEFDQFEERTPAKKSNLQALREERAKRKANSSDHIKQCLLQVVAENLKCDVNTLINLYL